MFKQSINRPLKLIVLCVCLTSANAIAGKEDFKKEVHIDSQKQIGDGKRRVTIFRGNVEINQGTLNIKADEVETDASRGDGKEILIAKGSPASYSQTTDDGGIIKAMANEIRYDVSTRILTLTGSAEVMQNTSMVRGDSITYNMEQEQLVAEGDSENKGRVTTILRPESFEEEDKDADSKTDEQQ